MPVRLRERLGHERRDQPALLRQRLDHVAVEHSPVARGERVVELEVLLELAVRVLVVGGVVVPPEAGHGLRDRRDEVEIAGQRAHVVTRKVERVELVGDFDRAVLTPADEEVLELGAHLQLEPELLSARQLVAQDRARTERPRLALDRHVAGEARHVRLPRQDRQRGRVGDRDHVRIVRALADVAGGEPGEAGALGEQVVDVVRRDELRARLAVHVDELSEQKLDLPLADDSPDVIGVADLRRDLYVVLICDSHVRGISGEPGTGQWPLAPGIGG